MDDLFCNVRIAITPREGEISHDTMERLKSVLQEALGGLADHELEYWILDS